MNELHNLTSDPIEYFSAKRPCFITSTHSASKNLKILTKMSIVPSDLFRLIFLQILCLFILEPGVVDLDSRSLVPDVPYHLHVAMT